MGRTAAPKSIRVCEILEEHFKGHELFEAMPGIRYDRIVSQRISHYDPDRDKNPPMASTFMFVERETGVVFMSGGSAPAKDGRFLLVNEDSMRILATMADIRNDGTFASTGFLYK